MRAGGYLSGDVVLAVGFRHKAYPSLTDKLCVDLAELEVSISTVAKENWDGRSIERNMMKV